MAQFTDAQLAAWGKRYGIALADVKELRQLCKRYSTQRVHFCNGDPHRYASANDKNACSQRWEQDSEKTAENLTALALKLGFEEVDYGVGCYPALVKDGDNSIHVPE